MQATYMNRVSIDNAKRSRRPCQQSTDVVVVIETRDLSLEAPAHPHKFGMSKTL